MILAAKHVPYTLIWGGKGGRVNGTTVFRTGIVGYEAYICRRLWTRKKINGKRRRLFVHCQLRSDGTLLVFEGTRWDFGSGAIDTPSVVIASLAHDMLCHLTNLRLIPWACRGQADKMYRVMLAQNGTGFARRWWQWMGVRAYSETVARWRDRK